MPFKVKVSVAGAEHEVELDAATLPESAVSEVARAHKLVKGDTFNAELDRRVQGVIKNDGYRKPDELLDDQPFVTKVLAKHGQQDAAKSAEMIAQRVETERRGWEEKHLKPMTEENAALKTTNGRLLSGILHKDILAAAAGRVKPEYLRPVGASRTPYIVAVHETAFGFDEKTAMHLAKTADGQGFQFSSDQKKYGSPYQGVAEYMEAWFADPANKDYLLPTSQPGPGMGGATGGPRTEGGIIWLTPEQAGDAETRRRANEDAKKTGAVVRTRMPAQPGM